ncbi:MAG: hypothetical protein WC028_00080 [Candidatus Obscuribacterales bacterium]|jgi:hypothetical protein
MVNNNVRKWGKVSRIVKTATDKFQNNDSDGNGYLGEKELRTAASNVRTGEE